MNQQLDISLIHRVLLTNPADHDKLTVTGSPRASTLSFADFVEEMNQSTSLEGTLKRAYRDSVAERRDALSQLLLELHEQMRLLVPNRSDLHSLLSDNVTDDIMAFVKKAATALQQLESPDRSESTAEWCSIAIDDTSDTRMTANSVLYLLYKTALCQQDKEDFYLQHVHSKQITLDMERRWHQSTYGTELPLTRRWIQSILNSAAYDSTLSPQTLISAAWIDTILFRRDDTLELPEVWALDVSTIQIIRETTKTAAVGSALGLLCCHVAGTSSIDLEDPCSVTSLRRDDLHRALSQRYACCTKEDFETKVSDAMVSLSRTMARSPISPTAVQALAHRSKLVLMGQDPVLAVLDKRIQQLFCTMVNYQVVDRSAISKLAKAKCLELGLGYASTELAEAVDLASRTAALCWRVHGVVLRDMLVQEAKQEIQA